MKRALVAVLALLAVAVPSPAEASGRIVVSCYYFSNSAYSALSTACYGTTYVYRGVVYRRFGVQVSHPSSQGRLTAVCGRNAGRRSITGAPLTWAKWVTLAQCDRSTETLISYRWTPIRPPIPQGDDS